jgi:hypothetical protein
MLVSVSVFFALEMPSELCHTLMSIRVRSTTYLGESQVSVAQALMRKLLFMKQK